MDDLIKVLEYACQQYYNEGKSFLTDDEYDSLAESINFKTVGAPVQDGIEHVYRMYSLQKFYLGEDSTPPFNIGIETIKLDGAAIALTYFNGKLVRILTRGDGKRGQDISHLIGGFKSIPSTIDQEGIIQITGEVVAPKSIENARNYAAGALNLKSLTEFKQRDLTFVAYGVYPFLKKTYISDMRTLTDFGFITVLEHELSEFPTDGVVVRLNTNSEYMKAGFTSTHPKGAYALKERKEGVITTLEDVIWQVGKSGVISPVGLIKPVKVGDATVSKATLHNIKYINELGLEIGCKVEVVRAGDIIPRITRRVD